MGACLAGLLAAGSVAQAQSIPNPNTGALVAAGRNATEQRLALAIGTICPTMAVRFGTVPGTNGGSNLNPANNPDASVRDLFQRCGGALNASATNKSTALQQIAPEEMIAQDAVISGAVAPQTQALAARIAALGGAGPAAARQASLMSVMQLTGAKGAAGDRVGRLDVFGSATYGWGDRKPTNLESGFDANGGSLFIGADYGLNGGVTIGAGLGYSDSKVKFNGGGGDITNKGYTLAAYSAFQRESGLYGSVLGAYSWVDYKSNRTINYNDGVRTDPGTTTNGFVNRVASGKTSARQYELGSRVGYSFRAFGYEYGPSIAVGYRKLDVDGFDENGALGLDMSFAKQNTESLQISAGGDVARSFTTGFGVVRPYARSAFVYEARNDKRTIDVRYRVDTVQFGLGSGTPIIRVQTTSPDRARFTIGGGVSAVFGNGFVAFADAEALVGQKDTRSYGLAIGVRREF